MVMKLRFYTSPSSSLGKDRKGILQLLLPPPPLNDRLNLHTPEQKPYALGPPARTSPLDIHPPSGDLLSQRRRRRGRRARWTALPGS